MTIRPAGVADEPALRDLRREAEETHARLLPDYFQIAPDQQANDAAHEKYVGTLSVVLVAEFDRDICGYVAVRIVDTMKDPAVVPRRRAQVDTVVVSPAMRRRGVGRALMVAAETWARERAVGEVVLTVWSPNRPAEALYRDLGYRPLARVLRRKLA